MLHASNHGGFLQSNPRIAPALLLCSGTGNLFGFGLWGILRESAPFILILSSCVGLFWLIQFCTPGLPRKMSRIGWGTHFFSIGHCCH